MNDLQSLQDYYKAAGAPLDHSEVADLARKAQAGDIQARNKLLTHNLRYVMKIAHKYRFKGVDYEDLVMEGNFGLIRAIEKFDPDRGNTFTTYAEAWVHLFISRAVMNQSRTVRVPVHMQVCKKQYKTSDLIRSCSIEKCAESDIHFAVADHTAFSEIEADEMRNIFAELVAEQKSKKRAAIVARFGLDGADEMSAAEVGKRIGITRGRVGQMVREFAEQVRPRLESMGITG